MISEPPITQYTAFFAAAIALAVGVVAGQDAVLGVALAGLWSVINMFAFSFLSRRFVMGVENGDAGFWGMLLVGKSLISVMAVLNLLQWFDVASIVAGLSAPICAVFAHGVLLALNPEEDGVIEPVAMES